MKNISIALLILCSAPAFAQGSNFYADKWKVFSLVQKYKDREMILFHRDSPKNMVDYTRYGIKFASDLTYKGSSETGAIINGTWSINQTKDTMTIDNQVYGLQELNANYMTLRTFSLETVDALGTLDTIYTDLKFYSLPDLTTSLGEGALTSESINVFPNPAKHSVEVRVGVLQKGVVSKLLLADLRGQVLKTITWDSNAHAQHIDLQELHAGIYLLEIVQQDGRRVAVKKIVKE